MNTEKVAPKPARSRRVLKALAVVVPVLLLVGYFAVGAVAAIQLTLPRRDFSPTVPHRTPSVPYQDVRFPARGGDVQIAGWYIPRQGSSRVVLMVHGKDDNRAQEFDGAFVDLASDLQRNGFAVLMIDLRGHGESGDGRFSFGLNERRDIEGAVDWLKGNGFTAGGIGLLGVSMGGASAIGAAADEPAVGALVVDSAFADFCTLLQVRWGESSGLPDFFIPSALIASRLLFGIDECAARPETEIGRIAPRPVLLIFSTTDDLIPRSQAQQLKAAAPFAEVWEATGPRHARIYQADPPAYTAKVTAFFTRSLK
ncbi:MAG: alpha/beta hydrolase [Chloroflexi bacterium]|nr:alpha/beta hydrolase [Chloroflexota bacterium]